ncbi:SDR family oxidoreductase, partial [Thomasclavelia sp.]|uniref:SDR family oxidoreductase n=1 Tax=Thomasclavelia sp. TaxID=3025757 RepID=UPI0025D2768F
MNNTELQGKVALVTGGGTGLGYGAAKRLSEAGAFVYIVGRRIEVLEKAALQLGKNVKALQGDVSKKSDLEAIANTIKANHQHLDIIFANAGFCKEAALEDISEDFFDTMINVNLKGTLFTV